MIDVPNEEHLPTKRAEPHDPRASTRAFRRTRTLRISDFCFITAGLAALTGMTMGIVMGISQDFTLAPAHAHLNLLGWVTMALYGLYHRSIGRAGGWLGWVQVLAGASGALVMSGGLAHYLHTGDDRLASLIIAGSLLVPVAMVLFLAIVLIDMLGLGASSSGASETTA
jgi:hypothetical protein